MALLEVEALEAWYGHAQILFGVSLTVAAGEAVMLLGRNGAGKSTTLKAIMGLEVERRGGVAFDGARIDSMSTHRIARLGLGYVPEDRRIFSGLTVEENLRVARLPARDGHAWTPGELFGLFPNLSEMRDRPGGRMSGTVARALMGNPRFLLMDEPSEGLAPVIIDGIVGAVQALKARGVGLLISEQNLAFARAIADRVYVIERGQIRFSGTLAELDADPRLRAQHLAV
jgi:branched-chain amino acid transport system ATP-binding protein